METQANFLDHMWTELRKTSTLSDDLFFILASSVCHFVIFWGLFAIYCVFDRMPVMQQYRVEKDKYPPKDLLIKCAIRCLSSHLFSFPLLLYMVQCTFPFRTQGSVGSYQTVVLQLLGTILIEDFIFFWSHRLLHQPALYRRFHKRHHEFNYVVGIASEYAHPVEGLLGNFMPIMVGPVVLKMHALTFLVWLVIRISKTLDAHSGYQFPWSPFNILCGVQNMAEKHYFHHSHNTGCYGSFLMVWDHLCGTDKSYYQYKQKLMKHQE